jgi:hypothetical protein
MMRAMTSLLKSGILIAALFAAACSSNDSKTDAGASCGTAGSCTAMQICVKGQNISSGAPMCPGDGGTCGQGFVLNTSSGCCDIAPTYSCQMKPSACSGGVTCDCAGTLCMSPQTCSAANDIEVDCTALVP